MVDNNIQIMNTNTDEIFMVYRSQECRAQEPLGF